MNQAGCLKCGRHHFCHTNSVDNRCRLLLCEDNSRVCDITGYVLCEVRHAPNEYCDTLSVCSKAVYTHDIDSEVYSTVTNFLMGQSAVTCRTNENDKLYRKLSQHMLRQAKVLKFNRPDSAPCMHHILSAAIIQEKYWNFIEEADESLVRQCSHHITSCLMELRQKGMKISSGERMRELVCGMLYMLKTGVYFNNKVLLYAIPEVTRCLPNQNKIQCYFGISSKVVCMTENEVKLIFRESYQK